MNVALHFLISYISFGAADDLPLFIALHAPYVFGGSPDEFYAIPYVYVPIHLVSILLSAAIFGAVGGSMTARLVARICSERPTSAKV
jgi:hypothetical protein